MLFLAFKHSCASITNFGPFGGGPSAYLKVSCASRMIQPHIHIARPYGVIENSGCSKIAISSAESSPFCFMSDKSLASREALMSSMIDANDHLITAARVWLNSGAGNIQQTSI